ncbi:MAG: E3 binding domain-containing protein [Rubrobacteraceae bacterium]
MTEERGSMGMDPAELWSKWYETSSKMWSSAMGEAMGEATNGGQSNFMDPYGLYRQWVGGMERMRDQMMSGGRGMPKGTPQEMLRGMFQGMMPQESAGSVTTQNLWNRWLEASAEGWQKTAQIGTEMMDLTPRWMQAMDQARDNLLSAQKPARDPLEFTVQWYNATNGPVSEFVQDLIEREEILEYSSRFLQSYASLYKIFRRNSEEYLSTLQLPVRSDITRVASLIVSLEDKVDRIEEAFEDFEYGYSEPATAESVSGLEGSIESIGRRVDQLEGKLDQLLAAVDGISTNGNATANATANVAETNGAEGSGNAEDAQPDQDEIKATNAARRKAQEMGVDLAGIQGSGADGQVTVGDVREKGAS